MKKLFRQMLSLMLVLAMASVGTPVFAEDGITVYVTLSNSGELARTSDGTVMCNVEVSIDASSGEATVDAVLTKLHDEYCADGYATEVSEYGTSVTKLWGVETSNTMYFINGIALSLGVAVDTVSDGDFLTASINADNTYYSDWYSTFDEFTKEAEIFEEFTLQLGGFYGMTYPASSAVLEPLSDIEIGVVDDNGYSALDVITDENGEAVLSFSEAGEYIISAKGTVQNTVYDWTSMQDVEVDSPIIAPFCVVTVSLGEFSGSGSESDPYVISSSADLVRLSKMCALGDDFSGKYFVMTEDVELPQNWQPIGTEESKFGGNFSGDGHLVTVYYEGLPLFAYTDDAVISDLLIYGEKIAGFGLINNYSSGVTATIDNVTLKRGTSTLKSGFIGGYASGTDEIIIKNSTVESGVVIGYDGQESNIGSFGGDFNGRVENCISYATVKGVDFVGGICANKGQSLGEYRIIDCVFDGTVEASGNYVGGISGAGYGGTRWGIDSAPQAACATILNCVSMGEISGADYVGGILGAEAGVLECWPNGTGYIQNNLFDGTVESSGSYTGGIIGFMKSLGRYNIISNNFYAENCGAEQGIGGVEKVITPETEAEGDFSGGEVYGRDDDPLGLDADKLTKSCTLSELSDGTVTDALNSGVNSRGDWVQGDVRPEFSNQLHITEISITPAISQNRHTVYENTKNVLSGKNLLVTYSDGTYEEVDIEEAELIGCDLTKIKKPMAVTVLYNNCAFVFELTVKEKKSSGGGGGGGAVQEEKEEQTPAIEPEKTEQDENPGFSDISGHWAKEGIEYVFENGLMNGTDTNTFSPDANLTRAMLTVILYRIDGEKATENKNVFSDVEEKSWYTEAVLWAEENKIVNGVGDGKFEPEREISREETATIIYRYVKFLGKDSEIEADLSAFSDEKDISSWAKEALLWANASGIINGTDDKKIEPQNTATRAETATMLMRFCENIL